MAVKLHTRAIEKGLQARGLLPANCRLIEISMAPQSALIIRYEVYVTNEQLALFAEAMKEAADQSLADERRIYAPPENVKADV